MTWYTIKLLSWLGLAWDVQLPNERMIANKRMDHATIVAKALHEAEAKVDAAVDDGEGIQSWKPSSGGSSGGGSSSPGSPASPSKVD